MLNNISIHYLLYLKTYDVSNMMQQQNNATTSEALHRNRSANAPGSNRVMQQGIMQIQW
jgi:hypothetical protein